MFVENIRLTDYQKRCLADIHAMASKLGFEVSTSFVIDLAFDLYRKYLLDLVNQDLAEKFNRGKK